MARRIIAIIAFAGFASSLFVHLATFFGIDAGGRVPCVWGLHVLLFPLAFLMIYSAPPRGFKSRASWDDLAASMPRWAKKAVGIFFAYALINFIIFLFLAGGDVPIVQDGKYILKRHGKIIQELTKEKYTWQNAYILRGFSGHWMFFYLVPALYFWYPSGQVDG
jgi:hypothetical protein